MNPFETANIFDLVFTIANSLISFAKVFYNFMNTQIMVGYPQLGLVKNPILGNYTAIVTTAFAKLTPLDILAGGGFTVIMILIILKKVVPLF